MKKQYLLPILLLVLTFPAQAIFPEPGTYDGNIGNGRIILVVETADSLGIKGYFVENRGKQVEIPHTFSINLSSGRPFFQSDLYAGRLKTPVISAASLDGKLSLFNRKRIFLFFRPRVTFAFIRRPENSIQPSERYRKEIFSSVGVKRDILYGKANGYWTSSPYSDEPYIEVLGKGLLKTFKDLQPLDLKMDIYYPEADTFSNRPLVMLIHGGAFYVGSKDAITERVLANTLARRGYVVASINYRLGFRPTPAEVEMSGYRAVQDAHAALRFLSHNAGEWKINPRQVYVGGTSAGAIASLNVAFMDNEDRPPRIVQAEKEGKTGKIEESGNDLTDRFEIRAVANMWGAVNDLRIIGRGEKIPVLSIQGDNDKIVPYEYDHPFKGTLGINRLIMDKIYGSKPIHEWLQVLGIRSLLVTIPGKGHEPELNEDRTLNSYIDTLTTRITRFFYEETAPSVYILPEKLVIADNSGLKPVPYVISNGSVLKIRAEGGVKATADPSDASVIWLKNSDRRNLTFVTANPFDAWNVQTFPVTLTK